MSVLFLPPPAGAASIPDASETVKGKIRIATSAEATAGTDDLTSMTPLKVKSVVDAAVVGGVTYQGTFDASSPADLSNASKGDLYIISVAGSYQGQDWAVGDHLLINADMGGTLDPNKIDKVDNTDSVTSVAGRTGAVVLSTADISGLATVATTGAYSDLSGTPSLATVATTGAYSDLSGTPDVPDFQTITVNSNTTLSSSLEDGCYLIMFLAAATVTIPAYPTGKSLVFRFVNFGGGACTVQQASGGTRLYEFGNSGITGVNSVNVASGATRTFHLWAAGSSVGLNYWSEASPSSTSATVAALDDIGDVDTTGVSTNNVLKYDGANWVDGSVAYSEVTGKPSFATIATTGDYSDLNDSVVVQQFNATATASAISSNALHVFRFYGAGGFTLTLSTATVTNGFALFNNISGSDVTVTGPTFRSNGEGLSGGTTSITVKAGERRLYYLEGLSLYLEANSTLIGNNGDVTISSPANGEALIYNSTSGDWENGTVSATVAALNDIGDVDTTGVSTNNVLKYDGANWVDGSVAYSEVTGTPTLGTAAALDVGTSANNVVQLNGSAQLPAVDGSQLTGISASVAALDDVGDVTITSVADGEFLKYDSTSGDWVNGDSGLYSGTTYSTTTTVPTPSQPQTLSIRLSNSSSQTLTLPTGSSDLLGTTINLVSIGTGEWTINPAAGQYVRGLSSALTLNQNQTAILTLTQDVTWYVVAYEEQGLGDLFDVTVSTPANGEALIYNSTSGDWENGTVSATVAALNDIGDVDTTGVSTNNVLKYDGANWVDGSVAYSEVTGTPTLATVATTGAYSDLSGLPTLGTAAALDVGTSATNVVQLDGSARLPAVDGSQLTNLPSAGIPALTSASPTSSPYNISTSLGSMEVYLLNPSVALTVNIPSAATATSGYRYNIKNLSTNTVTVTPSSGTIDGAANFALGVQNSSLTLVSDGSNWFVI